MADNTNIKYIGKRIKLIDPNDFSNQYSGNVFGDAKYNLSVPPEDLSIIVELKTNTKGRTVLTTQNSSNATVTTKNNGITVSLNSDINFLSGSTGNYLSTRYTDVSTELTAIEETLGITSIDIEFDSSYAPMVNINFVDVKGGSIFQSNGKSKYNVFFRLPYPLFELTIKGYYGKPVKYCLHMLKCNTKFNSQTGNFEIAAKFVGYTYALLSDMLIGYIKAAGGTQRGQQLLKDRNTISINEFLKRIAGIDNLIKNQLLVSSNTDTNNLAVIKQLEGTIESLNALLGSTVSFLNTGTKYPVYTSGLSNVVIVKDPNPGDSNGFDDFDNFRITVPKFESDYKALVRKFNDSVGPMTDLKITEGIFSNQIIVKLSDLNNVTETLRTSIIDQYNLDSNDSAGIDIIVKRLQGAARSIQGNLGTYVKFYDFVNIANNVDKATKAILQQDSALSKVIATNLKNLIKSKDGLGFEPSIRNIVKLFTTHIEVFLQQLFEVSSKYTDTNRLAELKKFKDNMDVGEVIYPWPEYQQDNVEKYLGSKLVLTTPDNVPEVKFVEELYQRMITDEEVINELNATTPTGVSTWPSTSPIDSYYYNTINPYDRLDANATADAIAQLVTLRATAFLGFSNLFLSKAEIEAFATNEANLILTKFKQSKTIYQGLNQKYTTPDAYAGVMGTINGSPVSVLTSNGSTWKYTYITENTAEGYRYIIPTDKGFDNTSYSFSDETASTLKLSSRHCNQSNLIGLNDTANYLDIFDAQLYEQASVTSASLNSSIALNYNSLRTKLNPNTNNDTGFDTQLASMGFLANNGKFGVQEFKELDYAGSNYGSGILDFSSLFYDNGNDYTPFLAQKRTAAYIKGWDLLDNKNNQNTFNPLAYVESNGVDIVSVVQAAMGSTRLISGYADYKTYVASYNGIYTNHLDRFNVLNFYSTQNNQDQISYPFFNFATNNGSDVNSINLFGSRFYNAQATTEAKALLFLHNFPWRGLVNKTKKAEIGIFTQPEILNIFQYRTGFIQVPKLLPAFIGGLIWRYEMGGLKSDSTTFVSNLTGIKTAGDPISFKATNDDWLIPGFFSTFGNNLPASYQYLKYYTIDENLPSLGGGASTFFSNSYNALPMGFNGALGISYANLEGILIGLPDPVKQKFVNEFLTFAQGGFNTLRSSFELLPVNNGGLSGDAGWVASWNLINNSTSIVKSVPNQTLFNIKTYLSTNGAAITDRYSILAYNWSDPSQSVPNYNFNNNYIIEYKQNSDLENNLKKLFFQKKYIANDSWRIWSTNFSNVGCNADVNISKNGVFDVYINALNAKLSATITSDQKKTFNNNENEEIKLEIYRTLKKIYDKWVAFTDSPDKILFQCCTKNAVPDRLAGDAALSKHREDNDPTVRLIDSFRFITRSFRDIGDDFQINPIMISKLLLETTNTSFYDLIGRVLTDNNFDFIALPTYIDYNNDDEIKSVFTPYPYYQAAKLTTSGPSFVCVYVGQTSTKLDFGTNADYPNDGFDLTNDCINCPDDIKDNSPKKDWEDVAAAFVVRYGQQNQNIFKDISLDQAEFSETAESLQITDNIANRLSQTNQTYVGQNLYNVFSVRSYKTEVQMMGNAMIQPMMYFQLENIPMFHGAYLITKVRHSIVPNHMSTTFTGVRIRANETPLVDTATLYSAILNGYTLPKATAGSTLTSIVSGTFPPIVTTIIQNGGSNGNPANGTGNIAMLKVPQIQNVNNSKFNEPLGRDSLITEATNALTTMLKAFVGYAKSNNYKSTGGNYISIMSLFRDYAKQEQLYNDSPKDGRVARPGRSNHGWGIAVDLQFVGTDGNYIQNSIENKVVGFDVSQNISLKWFLDNSYQYGFVLPIQLRSGGNIEEFWHFEYHGTAAKCLLSKNPNVKGYTVSVSQSYVDGVVINPKGQDGVQAVYNNCDYVTVMAGDGTDTLSTKLTKDQLAANQLSVKTFLKGQGLSKEIVAGIMGNIQKESGFNEKISVIDSNGYKSFGLIQWNTKSYDQSTVGNTVGSQLNFLVQMNNYTSFLNQVRAISNLTAFNAAFYFAKVVEICAKCSKLDVYNSDLTFKQFQRSEYANDFFTRFNTLSDPLAW